MRQTIQFPSKICILNYIKFQSGHTLFFEHLIITSYQYQISAMF